MGFKFSDARKKCPHDDDEQEPDVSADHLHWIADVEQSRSSGDHVGCEESSHEKFFPGTDRVGLFLLDD